MKQQMLMINRNSKAFLMSFPGLIPLPDSREVKGTTYLKSDRVKSTPEGVAVIYVEKNADLNLDNFADAKVEEVIAPLPVEVLASGLPETAEVYSPSSAVDKSQLPMTKVYGASDDLIEFEGAFSGEVGAYGTGDREQGVLLTISDGTVLEIRYGKNDQAIWHIKVLKKGAAYDNFDPCDDEDADIYSDVVILRGEIKWAYASTEWEKVQ